MAALLIENSLEYTKSNSPYLNSCWYWSSGLVVTVSNRYFLNLYQIADFGSDSVFDFVDVVGDSWSEFSDGILVEPSNILTQNRAEKRHADAHSLIRRYIIISVVEYLKKRKMFWIRILSFALFFSMRDSFF